MEHDQRACPRCGEPAGDSRFCQSCRAQMDSLTGIPTPAAAHEADPSYLAAQVLRLEQALAAASKGISDRIAGDTSTAVQVEPEPRAAENRTAEASMISLERAQFPTGVDHRAGNVLQPPREVARLEQLLTVAPVEAAPAEETELRAPAEEIELPAPAEELEHPAATERPAADPIYVTAQALREAFWFEQASAFMALRKDGAAAHLASQAVTPELQTPNTRSIAPPAPPAATAQPEADVPAAVEHGTSIAEPCPDGALQNHWLAALCVLVLIMLVALLTGRRARRLG